MELELIKVTASGEWTGGHACPVDHGNRGGSVALTVAGRWWVRFALYVGSPPGSHIGVWLTRWPPLYGANVRIGRRYVGPCVTAFVHARRREG